MMLAMTRGPEGQGQSLAHVPSETGMLGGMLGAGGGGLSRTWQVTWSCC